jgi:hypothetical protein
MYAMSTWALVKMTWPKFFDAAGHFAAPRDPVPWAGVLLIALAAMMLFEALLAIARRQSPPPSLRPVMA